MIKELPTIQVFATKDTALKLVHPTHGPMTEDGAYWPKDSFTSRRLTDGSVSLEQKKSDTKISETKSKSDDTDSTKTSATGSTGPIATKN